MTVTTAAPLISVEDVSMTFDAPRGGTLSVLEGVSLQIRPGEIVALLGKSGSGKSTLLRTIAGLISPSSGRVLSSGTELRGANEHAAMVFQTFALMPWLTVQDNVELGLEARGVPAAERRRRALDAIDMIGLDGFESAYPKELSGGMRQRVGFARALVLQPDLLLMDEPFSALDVLTAENLRTELMSLWSTPDFPIRSVCIVTHNIEEAVLMADRVLVLGANPGHIIAEVPIELPRPRARRSPSFDAIVDRLYGMLTAAAAGTDAATDPGAAGAAGAAAGTDAAPEASTASAAAAPSPLKVLLPEASVGGLAGLVEIIDAQNGQVDLPDLAAALRFEVDDLLPLVDAGVMLGLVDLRGVDAYLTPDGRAWRKADIQASKELFARLALARAPLVRTVCSALEHSDDGALRDDFFIDLLRTGMSEAVARRQLDTAIDWGRYAELYDFDADSGELVLAEVFAAIRGELGL